MYGEVHDADKISMLIDTHFEQLGFSPECGHGVVSKDKALDSYSGCLSTQV